jgi:hypothetical protein
MKKIVLSLLVIILACGAVNAQTTQKKPNELSKLILLKLQSEIGIDNNTTGKLYPVFESYFKDKAAITETAAGGENSTDPQVINALSELATKRDTNIKPFLNTVQYTKWQAKATALLQSIN